jgi:enoyl-CoA hydratase/carnithine racemase
VPKKAGKSMKVDQGTNAVRDSGERGSGASVQEPRDPEANLLCIERRGPVAWLTMTRGDQYNALSSSLMAALQQAFETIGADEQVRVIVLAGSGRAFCAGHDLREMLADRRIEAYQALFAQCTRMMRTIQRLPQPVIARVHGIATAAGCQLVASCDLAVAASDARFAVSGVNLGLFCSTPAVALSRNVGRKEAFDMLVTGEFIDAETARARGLVNRVVSPDRLDEAIGTLCEAIASKPPGVVATGKQLFYRQLEMGVDAAYQLAGQTMACNMVEDSAQEGFSAFVEKRKPSWQAG